MADECIGAELVIIHFVTGKYYGVRGSGVHIWRLLDAGLTEAEIAAKLSAVAPAGEDTLGLTAAFVRRLEQEELLVASAAIAPSAGAEPPLAVIEAFEAPEIEARDDLQDYLMLDPIHDVDEQGWPKPHSNASSST